MSLLKNSKVNLPKGWIVVNSTSFPDRVYYFNVRTGKSSWKEPEIDRNKTKSPQQSQKRKLPAKDADDDTLSEKTPGKTTPKSSGRRILRAKRSVETPKMQETPQMKAVRQKILEKKESKSAQNAKHNFNPLKSENNNRSVTPAATKPSRNKKTIPLRNPIKSATHESISVDRGIPSCSSSTSWTKSSTLGSSDNKKYTRVSVESQSEPNPIQSSKCKSVSRNNSLNKNFANRRLACLKSKLNTERKKIEPVVNAKLKRRSSLLDSETRDVNFSGDSIARDKSLGLRSPEIRGSLQSVNENAVSRVKSLKATLTSNPGVSDDERNKDNESSNAVVVPAAKIIKLEKKPARKSVRNLQNEKSVDPNHPAHLGNQCKDSFWEEMEWEPIEEEKVVVEIQEVRTQISTETTAQENLFRYAINSLELPQFSENIDKKILYIVVDTNVFLSNLKMVIEIIEDSGNIKSQFRPVVVVPWMVLQELDYIKDNKSKTKTQQLQKSAKTAVDTLFRYFSSKHPRLKGQTAVDAAANRDKFQVESPDDEILQSCLRIRELGYTVVLLSNDKNLCNKAIIHNISTYGRHESIQELLSSNKNDCKSRKPIEQVKTFENQIVTVDSKEVEISDDIFCEAKAVVKHFLTIIVSKEMEKLYGENWKKYTIVQPPWSVLDVLKCASKHWMAVISDVFVKPAESLIKELSKMFLDASKYGRSLIHVCRVLNTCHDLIQMVKSKDYNQVVEKSACDIKELIVMCNQKRKEHEKSRSEVSIELKNDHSNEEERACNAFKYFEQIWTFTKNFCGLSADLAGIPHSIIYENFDPAVPVETINRLRPEVVFGLKQLINSLRTVLDEEDHLTVENQSLIALYQGLVNYLPNSGEFNDTKSLDIFDLLCCIKFKREVLKTGLVQLQELCYQFCRIADFQSSTAIVFS